MRVTIRAVSLAACKIGLLCGALLFAGCGASTNPMPSISSLSPTSLKVGSATQTLTINGANFLATSAVTYTYQGVTNTTTVSNQATIPFWTFTLEDAESSFSYDNAVNVEENVPVLTSGTYSPDNGYLALTSLGQPTTARDTRLLYRARPRYCALATAHNLL